MQRLPVSAGPGIAAGAGGVALGGSGRGRATVPGQRPIGGRLPQLRARPQVGRPRPTAGLRHQRLRAALLVAPHRGHRRGQRVDARRGQVSVQPARQRHVGVDRRWRPLRCVSHRFRRPRRHHLPSGHGWVVWQQATHHAVQQQMAQPTRVRRLVWDGPLRLLLLPRSRRRVHQLWKGKLAVTVGISGCGVKLDIWFFCHLKWIAVRGLLLERR